MLEVTNLGTIKEDVVSIQDYDWEWVYQRVHKPFEKGPTTYWNLFVRDEHAEDYRVIPGVLSGDYSVLKTKDAVLAIQKALGGDIIGKIKLFRNNADISVSFILKEFQMNIGIDDAASKLLFSLMTDINVDELTQRTALSFNLINAMAGNRAMTLSYGFLTNLFPKNKAIKPLTINNTFILDEFTTSLVHDKKLAVTYHEVANVQKMIATKIQEYKDTPVPESVITEMEKGRFPRKPVKKIRSTWENLDPEFKNFYYLTFIISHAAGISRKIDFEIRARKFVSDKVKKIRKEMANKPHVASA